MLCALGQTKSALHIPNSPRAGKQFAVVDVVIVTAVTDTNIMYIIIIIINLICWWVQVCPAIRGIAASLQTALKPIFTRLEPKKDQQGNFIESPVPMYTFAIRCHNDLAKTVLDNLRFDTGLTTTVPAIR